MDDAALDQIQETLRCDAEYPRRERKRKRAEANLAAFQALRAENAALKSAVSHALKTIAGLAEAAPELAAVADLTPFVYSQIAQGVDSETKGGGP